MRVVFTHELVTCSQSQKGVKSHVSGFRMGMEIGRIKAMAVAGAVMGQANARHIDIERSVMVVGMHGFSKHCLRSRVGPQIP